jgi:quercetin dioxygenase-like cupin family protein
MMMSERSGYLRATGEGEAIWFLGTLLTVKAGSDETNGAFTLIEQLAPAGFGPPSHIHRDEDEGFYILEGELAVICGEKTWTAPAGAFVFLPRGIPHSFVVTSDGPAKLLQLTAPGKFERFAAEAGEPAQQLTLPPPSAPDVPKLLALMAKYGYDPVGPPPTE